MEAKYVQGIKAGIIVGVIISICIILTLIISVIANSSTALSAVTYVNCCIFIVIVALLAGAGALGTKMAAADIRDLNDAVFVSAIAGAVAGAISALVYFIDAILSSMLIKSSVSDVSQLYGYSPSEISALGIFGSLCCCGPILLVIAIILAVIGGIIYALAVLKIK